jgi:hypothetical protein
VCFRCGADLEIWHAGLDDGDARERVYLDDRAEASGRDDDRVAARDRASREPGPRAARHDRDANATSGTHAARDLVRARRDDDRKRRTPIEACVVLEHHRVLGTPEDVGFSADGDELADELVQADATARAMSA